MLTHQVTELQQSLTALQEETDTTITRLKQELADKANIVETLQQQIRMKMFMNLTREKSLQPATNPVMAALADLQGEYHGSLVSLPQKFCHGAKFESSTVRSERLLVGTACMTSSAPT